MLQKCKIIDTTLREGEQTPGVLFSIDQKKSIIDGLSRIGIDEVELGIASPLSSCLPALIAHCRSHHPQLQISLWSRCRIEDIHYAASLKPDIISLSLPASDLHLESKLGKDRVWALRTLSESIVRARELSLKVSVGFEDATRTDPLFLEDLVGTAEKAGAFRIRIADTVGTASPTGFGRLVKQLRKILTKSELAVHTHNDFGMAGANGISALENGANWADVTILGLGERCGCAKLEELVGYLALAGSHTGYNVQHIKPLARLLAPLTGRQIADNQPILGEKIFTCETGLHLQGLQQNPETYEPYAPEKVGAQRQLLFGSKVGRAALVHHLQGLDNTRGLKFCMDSLEKVRNISARLGRPLTDSELTNLIPGSCQP